jgi:hypothetical protein
MAKYRITSPTGEKFDITAPDNASQDQVMAYAQQQFSAKTNAPEMPEAPKNYTAGESAIQGVMGLPGGAFSAAVETGKALLSPVKTGKALLDLGAGELQKVLPQSVTNAINRADEAYMGKQQSQAARQQMANIADVVNKDYAEYGSWEGAKRKFAEHPEAVLADLSTVLTGGASLASKAPKLASALKTASNVTNPLVMAEKMVTVPANAIGTMTKGSLGITTGAGGEAIDQAVKAGETSNKVFLGNLRKASNMEDAVDIAKTGLDKMRSKKNAEYRSGMYDISQDKSILSFDDIDSAIQSAKDKNIKFGEYIDEDAHKALLKAEGIVNKWKTKAGEAHTPEGFDALKQKVYNEVLGKLDFQKDAFARNIVGDIYSGIKGSINNQAPEYAKVMKNYGEAADTIDEIKKALSLKEKASADTSLKKLQSILRDDVSSSFGHRKQLAEKLIENGAEDLMPALAGQALSSWKPRGMLGNLEMAGGLALLLTNPAALGSALMAAPAAMPRVVGEAAYAYGKGKGAVKKAAQKLPVNKEQARKIGLMLMQANQANEAQQGEQ